MEKNFFCIEEAIRHFGVNPTRQQRAALLEVPFSDAVLEQCKDTHVLVAVFDPQPLTNHHIRVNMCLNESIRKGTSIPSSDAFFSR